MCSIDSEEEYELPELFEPRTPEHAPEYRLGEPKSWRMRMFMGCFVANFKVQKADLDELEQWLLTVEAEAFCVDEVLAEWVTTATGKRLLRAVGRTTRSRSVRC